MKDYETITLTSLLKAARNNALWAMYKAGHNPNLEAKLKRIVAELEEEIPTT